MYEGSSVNPIFQVRWIHLERPRAAPERQNEQYWMFI